MLSTLCSTGAEWGDFNTVWSRKRRFDMYGANLLHTHGPALLNVMLAEIRHPYVVLPVSS